MRCSVLVLLLLLSTSFSSAYLISTHREQYEAEWGEDKVRIIREAEILWVRENKIVLFDWLGNKNTYVSQLSDQDIIHIMKNDRSRAQSGINEVNMTPYMYRVRGVELVRVEDTVNLSENESDNDSLNTIRPDRIGSVSTCVKQRTGLWHDPFKRVNHWLKNTPNGDLKYIVNLYWLRWPCY